MPVEYDIESLLAFARTPPSIAEYEAIARERGLRIVEERVAPEYRLFRGARLGLMLVDGKLARLHAAALFESNDEEGDEKARTARGGRRPAGVGAGALCVAGGVLRPRR